MRALAAEKWRATSITYLCCFIAAVRGVALRASPGADLDWTEVGPTKVTTHLLRKVEKATASWDHVPDQLRHVKNIGQNLQKLTTESGNAVKGLQGEMDKAYAAVEGLDGKLAPAEKQAKKPSSEVKHGSRADKAIDTFFARTLDPKYNPGREMAAQTEASDWLDYIQDHKQDTEVENRALQMPLESKESHAAAEFAASVVNSKPLLNPAGAPVSGSPAGSLERDVSKALEGNVVPNTTSTDAIVKALPTLKDMYAKASDADSGQDPTMGPINIVDVDTTRDAAEYEEKNAVEQKADLDRNVNAALQPVSDIP